MKNKEPIIKETLKFKGKDLKKWIPIKIKKPTNKYKLLFQILFISLAILGTLFILGKVAYLITLHKLHKDWEQIYVPTDITVLDQITQVENKVEKTTTRSAESRETNETNNTYKITAYCPCIQCCGKTDGITASGIKATANHTIATSSKYAFGTKIEIDGIVYTVEDRGGAIGKNRIDLYMDSHQSALNYGVQYHTIKVVE